MNKKCSTCGQVKPFSEFYKRKASRDGLTASCKSCQRRRDSDRYQNDPRVKERHKRYHGSDAGKASMERARKKWADKSPEKRKAHIILGNAVKDGRVEKPKSCSICGATGRIHGHHDDYSKPLDVVWCCSKCHRKIHAGA